MSVDGLCKRRGFLVKRIRENKIKLKKLQDSICEDALIVTELSEQIKMETNEK